MKIRNTFYSIIACIILSVALHSCKPDPNNCDNCETELITTVNVALTDSATGTVTHFIFRDLDGDGANAPVRFDTIKVLANHTYTASLLVLDESKTPADTISNEILEEANDHQFFFHSHDVTVDFTYLDFDSNTPPMPVGLLTKWTVGSITGIGKVHVTLKHQSDTKDGNEANGETDLDIEFNVLVP